MIVVAAIGLVLMPRMQSVASLRKEYLAGCSGSGWREFARYLWSQMRQNRAPNSQAEEDRRRKRIEVAEKGLIERGYLQERTFAVSNFPPALVAHRAVSAWCTKFSTPNGAIMAPDSSSLVFLGGRDQDVIARARFTTNAVIVVTPPNDMAKWAELVSEVESAVQKNK